MADPFDDGFEKSGDDRFKPLNIKEKPARLTAVALQDGDGEGALPVITAAGRGKIAEQILQLAFENGINVRTDADLAELLATIELESPIPSEAFMAVAEILSYVYSANGTPDPFNAILKDAMDGDHNKDSSDEKQNTDPE